MSPYQAVKDFEKAICEYTGAPHAVTVSSCTMAVLLSCAYWKTKVSADTVSIPCRTYLSIPQALKHAGFKVSYRNEKWIGGYKLNPLPVWDCARWLRGGMYMKDQMMCLSFHPTKHLGISTHGGAILTDSIDAAEWLKRARYDGRKEGVDPKDDNFSFIGWRCFMMPPTAAEGLERLSRLPYNTKPLPNSDYPDLSKIAVFQ